MSESLAQTFERILGDAQSAAERIIGGSGMPTTEPLLLAMLKLAWTEGRLNGLAWSRESGE